MFGVCETRRENYTHIVYLWRPKRKTQHNTQQIGTLSHMQLPQTDYHNRTTCQPYNTWINFRSDRDQDGLFRPNKRVVAFFLFCVKFKNWTMAKSSSGIFGSENVAVFLSELLGTALLVFIGCSSCLNWTGTADTLQIVLSFGFAVLICVQIFGCVSGAHINPSVTLAALVYKLIDFKVETG